MAEAQRVVRQWLETEAALGVSEVPLAVRGGAPAAGAAGGGSEGASAAARQPVAPPTAMRAPMAMRPVAAAPVVRSAPAPMPPENVHFGTELVRSTAVPAKKVVMLPPAPAGNIAALDPITRGQKEAAFAALRQEIEQFAAPFINQISTRTVFGEGDCDAALMFIGEGPGAEEDRTGRPFVGRSGQLLDKMIAAIGYQRAQVFIGNIVKLRAADWTEDGSRVQDRPPSPEEVARWIPFLHRQIEIIRPRVIVTLGAPAVKYLTGTTEGVMKIRGTWLSYRGIPVMPTYHPSFVLRAYTEENRRKVWNDLKAAVQRVQSTP